MKDHGLADALGKVCAAQRLPFRRELRALREDRHEVDREGFLSAAGQGADDEFRRDLNKTEARSGMDTLRRHKLVQRRKICALPLRRSGAGGLLPEFERIGIVVQVGHGRTPFSDSVMKTYRSDVRLRSNYTEKTRGCKWEARLIVFFTDQRKRAQSDCLKLPRKTRFLSNNSAWC